jgi:hypothetical protein
MFVHLMLISILLFVMYGFLTINLVFNVDLFASYHGFIVRRINDDVKVLGEHVNTQVKVCG